ncbi:MAG: YkgJ family cysteine cluster protein [bacterium]
MRLSFLGYTIGGALTGAYLKLARREFVVAGECAMCGRCCRNMNLYFGSRWIRSETEFRRLVKKRPEYERFEPIGRTVTGILKFRCAKLNDGLCADHENRPDFCREYPPADLPLYGAGLDSTCGYRFEIAPSFKNILRSAERGPVRECELLEKQKKD